MSKPDWAERLQRTFKRKYEQGRLDELKRVNKIINDLMDSKDATLDILLNKINSDKDE